MDKAVIAAIFSFNIIAMETNIGHIPKTSQKRVVIIGGGFAGLTLAQKLAKSNFQVVLLDRYNFHQFQPLYYQVATAGLEPSAISFPFRKIFQNRPNVHFRLTEVKQINPEKNEISTSIGQLSYDYLAICTGANTNYFGMSNVERYSLPMKTTGEALGIRNMLIQNFEAALNAKDDNSAQIKMNVVIVGGGPTGVELAGAIAEMKKYVLPKDYPELNFGLMQIYLIEAAPRLLGAMSETASERSLGYLQKLGVQVQLQTQVKDYDGTNVILGNSETLRTNTVIWAAGVRANSLRGLPESAYVRGGRLQCDMYNRVQGFDNIFALGDTAFMTETDYPNGHPQVAPAAIQQAQHLVKNLKRLEQQQELQPFHYYDKGSLATVGRNMAVADLTKKLHLKGFLAWIIWLFVHLMSIVGVKNRMFIFLNWAWSYFTFDQSLRLILKPTEKISPAAEIPTVAPPTAAQALTST